MTDVRLELAEAADWLRTVAPASARLTLDSRTVREGDVFVALKGANTDGLDWAARAVAQGASAVLYEPRNEAPSLAVPVAAVRGLRRGVGIVASSFYGHPSVEMDGVGITGTNGKTSISHWVSTLLTQLGAPCAAIGTIGAFFNGMKFPAPALTTPDAASTQTLLRDLRKAGAAGFAIEASSIGLDQGRLLGTYFRTAVFTNLTRDHLDYHGTFEAYEAAKAVLFDWPGLQCAVINADDPCGLRFAARTLARGVRTIAYTVCSTTIAGAERLCAENIHPTAFGTSFAVTWRGVSRELHVKALGRFNVSNLLAVAAVGLSLGFDPSDVFAGIERLTPPAGRLQMVHEEGGPLCVVDYAHTPDALEKALEALRETARHRGGRLVAVFGAGGDRDHGKRPQMGRVASAIADAVVVTSDNPRSEEPQSIIDMILAGCSEAKALSSMVDRAAAIEAAVLGADSRDVILVAGKGHEDYQEIQGVKHHFDDVEMVKKALAKRRMSND